jgi:cytochrome c oxidase assembly factor 4
LSKTPKNTPENEDEEEDPVEKMIKKTGCMDYHYKVQECIVETRDWRKCQPEVERFRQCMSDYNKRREKT